jgi:hypothetical protein
MKKHRETKESRIHNAEEDVSREQDGFGDSFIRGLPKVSPPDLLFSVWRIQVPPGVQALIQVMLFSMVRGGSLQSAKADPTDAFRILDSYCQILPKGALMRLKTPHSRIIRCYKIFMRQSFKYIINSISA